LSVISLVRAHSFEGIFLVNRREFIKIGVAGAVGFGIASAIEIPILENQNNLQTSKNETQISNLQSQLNEIEGFLTLNADERPTVEALAETIFPSDSNGPGAKEAGVIYFIDRMLAGNYGQAAGKWWFMQGPFIQPQAAGTSVTVMGAVYPSTTKTAITYTNGTIKPRLQAGTAYQYSFTPREFWRRGLMYLNDYCQAAKGSKFESLSADTQNTVLQEMFDNKSDNTALQSAFQGPTAAEFFNEIHDLVTAGYWTDPLYGGNQGKVGWDLLAFPGLNQGSSQGYNGIKLATTTTPVRLSPLSLGDVQKGATM
jgi:gluconate 2-dehydrogenase gamma chain